MKLGLTNARGWKPAARFVLFVAKGEPFTPQEQRRAYTFTQEQHGTPALALTAARDEGFRLLGEGWDRASIREVER